MSRLGPGSGPIASSSQLCLRACVGRDGSERPCHLVVPGPFCRLCSQSPQPGYHCHSKFWMCSWNRTSPLVLCITIYAITFAAHARRGLMSVQQQRHNSTVYLRTAQSKNTIWHSFLFLFFSRPSAIVFYLLTLVYM